MHNSAPLYAHVYALRSINVYAHVYALRSINVYAHVYTHVHTPAVDIQQLDYAAQLSGLSIATATAHEWPKCGPLSLRCMPTAHDGS